MRFTKAAVVAALAISMAATPVLSQSAAPLSVAGSVSRAGASSEDANRLDTSGYLLPAVAIIAILAAAILISKNQGDNPSSP
jgi:hypothetical protein